MIKEWCLYYVPLGLPAQKGWEFHSPLSGSHHPRLSGKFVADSVFIDAFVNCLLNLSILYHHEAAVSIQWSHKKTPEIIDHFLRCAQVCVIRRHKRSFPLSIVRHYRNHSKSSTEIIFSFFIWQMRMSRKSSREDDCRELPGS